MDKDIILLGISIIASGGFSWLVTHIYYKKSLKQQESAAHTQISELTKALESQSESDATLIRQKRIEESIEEYRRAGTPARVIDTYSDLTNEEKAELLDTVLMRVKGRPAKNNKYRVQ